MWCEGREKIEQTIEKIQNIFGHCRHILTILKRALTNCHWKNLLPNGWGLFYVIYRRKLTRCMVFISNESRTTSTFNIPMRFVKNQIKLNKKLNPIPMIPDEICFVMRLLRTSHRQMSPMYFSCLHNSVDIQNALEHRNYCRRMFSCVGRPVAWICLYNYVIRNHQATSMNVSMNAMMISMNLGSGFSFLNLLNWLPGTCWTPATILNRSFDIFNSINTETNTTSLSSKTFH